MKQKIAIIVSVFFLMLISEHSNSVAQTGWFPLHSIYSHDVYQYGYGFQSVHFLNADTGFLSTHSSGGYSTTDGGVSWNKVYGLGGIGGGGGNIIFSPTNKVGYWGFSYNY